MFLKQLYLGSLAQASYLVGDESSGKAAVVDPRRDVDIYLEVADAAGLRIEHVLLTAAHGSFVAGHLELQALTDAKLWLGDGAAAGFDVETMEDGGELPLGPSCCLRFLSTPGHRPEATSILVADPDRDEPHAVLSGDTLLVGGIGRPTPCPGGDEDLEEMSRALHHSLFERLLGLPEATLLYPGHGSLTSAADAPRSSIGEQREHNPGLQPVRVEDFVEAIAASPVERPQNFNHIRSLNLKARPLLGELLSSGATALALNDALRLANTGAQLLDVRDAESYAEGRLEDSVNVGLDGRFALLAGAVLPVDAPIVLIADAGREEEAARKLARIGLRVEGYLAGAMDALTVRQDLLKTSNRTEPSDVSRQLAGTDPPFVIDVRSRADWDQARIAKSACIPVTKLRDHVRELPRDREIITCSESGYRSSTAMGILARNGFTRLSDLRGGLRAWRAAALPLGD